MSYTVKEEVDPPVGNQPGARRWVVYCGSRRVASFKSPEAANARIARLMLRDALVAERAERLEIENASRPTWTGG